MWDEPRNAHLFMRKNLEKAQILINIIDELGMQMILPAETPMLKPLATGNLTRPDNVFATENIAISVIGCTTKREETPPKADHFPIITKINTTFVKKEEKKVPNFKTADWALFKAAIIPRIRYIPTCENITDQTSLDNRLKTLTEAIRQTITEEVQVTEVTAFTRRWWTRDLTEMNNNLRRIRNRSRKRRHDTNDPIHEEECVERNRYIHPSNQRCETPTLGSLPDRNR